MDLRTRACFAISRRMLRPPETRNADAGAYGDWRSAHLAQSFGVFDDERVTGKDVLDFGCGNGQLALYLATEKRPRRMTGTDINGESIASARESLRRTSVPAGVAVDFVQGTTAGLPFPAQSFDTLLAFDCMEHVMEPAPILAEWHRVLRPGGRCLIEWFPFKGPWGPHMEALIPVPWAHVVFGQRAMFRTAEMIYDLPQFVPRHWDLDEQGRKKPNKWRAWSSFREQNFINELDIPTFQRLARAAGFGLPRVDRRSFGGSGPRRALARALMSLPRVGEYFVSSVVIELERV